LNSQIDGTVQHRVHTLPIWLGDKLLEINFAIYEQRQNHENTDKIDSKRILLSFEMESLGLLDIEIWAENKNLRLKMSSDSYESSRILLEYGGELNQELVERGWALDEISYTTKHCNDMGDIVGSVVDHFLSQESLSRLV
jgi:hypothetical protein